MGDGSAEAVGGPALGLAQSRCSKRNRLLSGFVRLLRNHMGIQASGVSDGSLVSKAILVTAVGALPGDPIARHAPKVVEHAGLADAEAAAASPAEREGAGTAVTDVNDAFPPPVPARRRSIAKVVHGPTCRFPPPGLISDTTHNPPPDCAKPFAVAEKRLIRFHLTLSRKRRIP